MPTEPGERDQVGNRVVDGPRAAMAAGLALVPEDRKTQGLILPLPVRHRFAGSDMAPARKRLPASG